MAGQKKTCNCIICGKKAVMWHGYVSGLCTGSLGNMFPVKIAAGFCEEHKDSYALGDNRCYCHYDEERYLI